ncbi:MAG: 50S ribosomal protein L3 [Candidatus Nanoarchaeia archaeon]
MAKRVNPRHGSMQFWPRVRASRQYAKVRSVPQGQAAGLLGFAGYKAGMTHVIATDTYKNSNTKGEQISIPVTVIECPPLRITSVRVYKAQGYGTGVSEEFFFKGTKDLSRKCAVSKNYAKKEDLDNIDISTTSHITVQVQTQPTLAGFGKKKPEVFELPLGGSIEEQITFAKDNVEQDVSVKDVLKAGSFVDVRAVTTGRGYQGPVKRFGVSLRAKKSEKVVRGPGSLGSWKGQGHMMYRIAYAGQTGYHARIQYSNYIVGIEDDVSKLNPQGGFINYGEVKNTYVLVKGSLPGPKKRLVMCTPAHRKGKANALPSIDHISIASQQGN